MTCLRRLIPGWSCNSKGFGAYANVIITILVLLILCFTVPCPAIFWLYRLCCCSVRRRRSHWHDVPISWWYLFSLPKCCSDHTCNRSGDLMEISERGTLYLQCCSSQCGMKSLQSAARSPACLGVTERKEVAESREEEKRETPTHEPATSFITCLLTLFPPILLLLKSPFSQQVTKVVFVSLFLPMLRTIAVPDYLLARLKPQML